MNGTPSIVPTIRACAIALVMLLLALASPRRATAGSLNGPQTSITLLQVATAVDDPDGADAPPSGWHHFVSWVGHFHPPLTAFPIAMLVAAALAELLRLLGGAAWLEAGSRWCVALGALAAVVTVPLGWAFAVDHARTWVLEVHRWLGTAAGCGAVVILIVSELGRRKGGGWMALFRVILFAAVPLVLATAFFGGAMVYGLHEYDWNKRDNPADSQDTAAIQSPADKLPQQADTPS